MKIRLGLMALGICVVAATANAQNTISAVDKAKIEKTSFFISSVAKKLSNGKSHNTAMNWQDNEEVKEVAGYPDAKRISTLYKLIQLQKTNEEKVFPKASTVMEQAALTFLNRLQTYYKYQDLIGKSANDVIVKDYLDGEVADLRMVFSGKMPDGLYLKGSAIRKDKLDMLIMQDKEVMTEYLTMMAGKDPRSDILAIKTFMISLTESCMENMDICAKLSGK